MFNTHLRIDSRCRSHRIWLVNSKFTIILFWYFYVVVDILSFRELQCECGQIGAEKTSLSTMNNIRSLLRSKIGFIELINDYSKFSFQGKKRSMWVSWVDLQHRVVSLRAMSASLGWSVVDMSHPRWATRDDDIHRWSSLACDSLSCQRRHSRRWKCTICRWVAHSMLESCSSARTSLQRLMVTTWSR